MSETQMMAAEAESLLRENEALKVERDHWKARVSLGYDDQRKLEAEIARLRAADNEIDSALKERDDREEVIEALCDAVLGVDRTEWSSAYGFADAVLDVQERVDDLLTPTAQTLAEQGFITQASRDVVRERVRQTMDESYTHEHDDEHDDGALAKAAAGYAVGSSLLKVGSNSIWPADWHYKPKDKRSNLVRAGALILAEIERLDRAEAVLSGQDPQP